VGICFEKLENDLSTSIHNFSNHLNTTSTVTWVSLQNKKLSLQSPPQGYTSMKMLCAQTVHNQKKGQQPANETKNDALFSLHPHE
jgi:hypothetical protein